jgi:hypothetical protein
MLLDPRIADRCWCLGYDGLSTRKLAGQYPNAD